MEKTISINKASKDFIQIIEDVQKDGNYCILTEKGKPKAVMLSYDDFDGWMETIDVIQTCPYILEDTKEMNRDIKSGAYKNYMSLEEIIAIQKSKNKDKKSNHK